MFDNFSGDNKDDNFLNEFRQKLANQSANTQEEKQKEMQRSKSVFLGATAGVALACVVGWFALAPKYSNNENAELPVVRRPQTAIKIKPSEPGGMEIPNQDKSIYNVIDKEDRKVVENLLPLPEQPITPDIAPEVENIIVAVGEAPAPLAVMDKPKQAEKTISIAEAIEKDIIKTPDVDVKKELAKANIEEKKEVVVKTEPKKEVVIAKVEPKKEEVKTTSKEIAKGSWQVQLISSKDKTATEKSWLNLQKKHVELKSQPYEIEEADVSGSTFYRLKAGAFSTRTGADELCNAIKAAKGSCLVKQK